MGNSGILCSKYITSTRQHTGGRHDAETWALACVRRVRSVLLKDSDQRSQYGT